MSKHQRIKQLLELGTLKGVGVLFGNGGCRVFTHTDRDGNLYATPSYMEYKTCLENYSHYKRYTKTEIYQCCIDNITPIPLKPKILEKGTEVEVIAGEHKGKICKVADHTEDGAYILDKDGAFFDTPYSITAPHYAVVPVWEKEKTKVKFNDDYIKFKDDFVELKEKLGEELYNKLDEDQKEFLEKTSGIIKGEWKPLKQRLKEKAKTGLKEHKAQTERECKMYQKGIDDAIKLIEEENA